MHSLYILIWIFAGDIFSASSSSCYIHDRCFEELKKFIQFDKFHVYTSLQEAEAACSEAKDAYLCIQSDPKCLEPSEEPAYIPVLRSSSRLLNEFCGFRAKRRPCCALRTSYLEHSDCYEEMSDRLNECNEKYRSAQQTILGIEDENEQKQQRYCAIKWFGNCVKKETQSYCGNTASQIIRSYALKAGQYPKESIQENDRCSDTLYVQKEVSENFCQQKYFDRCQVHIQFLHEYLIEDRLTDDDKFLSICTGIHDSFECLNRAFKNCLFGKHGEFKELEEMDDEKEKNKACIASESVLKRYQGNVHCLVEQIPELQQCKVHFEDPVKYSDTTMLYQHYKKSFCGLITNLQQCMITTASSNCSPTAKGVMADAIKMAAVNLHRKCNF